MDRFELNWPNLDAQLLTDGWRCRIVWRQRGRNHANGIGGTIDNNLLCVRRLAESLDGSPYLLGALRSRGHDRLARQIESAVGTDAAPPARAERREAVAPAPAPAIPPVTAWLQGLSGSDGFAAATNRRAKSWMTLGELGGEEVALKAPAAKGKAEWVIKRTRVDEPKRKAEYVAASEFKGIARWLVEAGADEAFVERLLDATSALDDAALASAAAVWRSVRATTTH